MNIRRCLRIAERLQKPFEQQVGIAIDAHRMVSDQRYALDVLTVCEARPDSPLATLAQHFRLAASESGSASAADPHGHEHGHGLDTSGWSAESTGFGTTHSPAPNSAFEQARQAARAARRSPTWMSPGRWPGSDS